MVGEEQARATADKLRVSKTTYPNSHDNIEPITDKTGIKTMDPELMAMMKADAEKQTEEDGGLQPWLRVFDSARSTYSLRDGSTPHHGWFFYQPEEIELDEILVHILYISKGFRSEGMKEEGKEQKFPYQHIVSGILLDMGNMKPFWMTIAGGARLNRLWDFRGELAKKARAGYSKFALVIQMKTERVVVKDQEGKDRVAQVINFNFIEDDNGNLELCSKNTYPFLRDKSEEQKELVDSYIDRRAITTDKKRLPEQVQEKPKLGSGITQQGDAYVVDTRVPNGTEEVNPDDIPF